jgi:hypothetical protein
MSRARTALHTISHCAAAFAVFMKGLEKADHFSHTWPFVMAFWFFAVLILLFTVFHRRVEGIWKLAPSFVSLVEAAVFALVAVYTFRQGKHLLPYAWSAVSLAYVAVSIKLYVRPPKHAQP